MSFSFWDFIYSFYIKLYLIKRYDDEKFRKRYINYTKDKELWIIFLGWEVKIDRALRLSFAPKRGKVLFYEIQRGFINKDPRKVKKMFLELIKDCKKEIAKNKGDKIKIISFSAANGYGFYIANNCKVDKFYSVVTGAKLGQEMWGTSIAEEIVQDAIKMGYKNSNKYDKTLGKILPYYNVKNLPNNTEIWLGLFDSIIPSKFGIQIAKKVKKYNNNVKIRILPFGHIFTSFFFGISTKLGFIK